MNFNDIFPALEHLGFSGYWIILIISFFESLAFIGLFVPGALLAILFGLFASQGLFKLNELIWFITIGGILGDFTSYYLGKKGARFFRFIKKQHLEKAERFINKHGHKSIFLGKFIGPLRPIVPFVSGILKMNIKKFAWWSFASTLIWAICNLFIGFFIGRTLGDVDIWSTRIAAFLFYIGIILIIIYILKWLIIKKGKQLFRLIKSIMCSITPALRENQDIKKFANKHPKLVNFLKLRLTTKNFNGLPATFLVIIFIYAFINFLGIIEDILTVDTIASVDIHLENLLFSFRHPFIAKFFLIISLFGKWQIVASIAVVFMLILWLGKKWIYILPFILTFSGSILSDLLSKVIIHRPRPEAVAFYHEGSYSFPSGHATVAIAIYGFIAYFLIKINKRWKFRINLFFIFLVLIFAIGFSRLYLGVHYLSDVLGGYFLGLMWLIASIFLYEWLIKKKIVEQVIAKKSPLKIKLISLSLIIIELVFFVSLAINYKPTLLDEGNNIDLRLANNNVLELFSGQWSLPRYSETLSGKRDAPLSFIITAKSDQQLNDSFERANWLLAEKQNLKSIVKLAEAFVFNLNYTTAPMTPSFWNTQVHNFGFEKPTAAENIKERHHARFWKTNLTMPDGKLIYVGTASLDEGLKKSLIIHKINPNIDAEREQLFIDLKSAGVINDFSKTQFVEPLLGTNFAGDLFFTDGVIYIITIK